MDTSDYSFLQCNSSLKICRCCLTRGCFKDLTCEYYHLGQREVYNEMFRDTFNLELSNTEEQCTNFICNECIKKIRDSHTFKQQVKDCGDILLRHLKQNLEDVKNDQTVKETCHTSDNELNEEIEHDIQNKDEDYDSVDDHEILADVKIELAKDFNTTPRAKRRRCRTIDKKIRTGIDDSTDKSVKAETNDIHSQRNIQSKIIERRGNGPILRENSLKLIQHSTMCVFQWNKSQYRCFCCKEPFTDMDSLRSHTDASHNLKTIEKKIITQQNRLVKVEISKLFCRICSKSLEKIDDLKRHLAAAHDITFDLDEDLLVPFKLGTQPLQCQLCSDTFTMFRLLNIHVNKHYQKQVCHICGAGFSNLVFLNLHRTRSHRVIKCNECDIEFSSRSAKRNHDITTHNVKYERKLRFPCTFCDARFSQENLKIKHLVDNHGMKKPQYNCQMCTKEFITRSLLNNHVKNVHMKEKRRECDICQMRFYTKSDVARHRVTHTGEKNFTCGQCHNSFATKDSLRRHNKRTHSVASS